MTPAIRLNVELIYDEGRGDAETAEDYIMDYITSNIIEDVEIGSGGVGCYVHVILVPYTKVGERTLKSIARQVTNALTSMHWADNIQKTRWTVDAVEVDE